MTAVVLQGVSTTLNPTEAPQHVDTVRALCHDLRQPLAVILLLAGASSGEVQRRLDGILDQAQWLSDMVEGVIGGAADDTPERVDVVDVARRCVLRAQQTAECQVEFIATGRAMTVAAPVALGRAICCAMDNAVRAAGEGGSVAVDVTASAHGILIRIIDDGPGLGNVPTHNLPRSDNHASSCLQLRWWVRAPAGHHRRHGRADHPSRYELGGYGVMRLILCDDHRMLLDALSLALNSSGHTVVATAIDPDEAVDAARQHQPDVCLLDINFPHSNGLAAIGRIHEVSPATKVVILSGSSGRNLVADAIAEGAQGFVGKEKPVGVIVAAMEMAVQGQLAVDLLLLQEVLRPTRNDDPLWMLKFLTEREWEVMRCIMDGLSTEQMAEQLCVQRSTARTHVQNLLTKLGVHSRLQAAALMTAHASAETWPVHMR